ncbi:microtubule-actin cross-linking factor isoforms 1 2 3 5-like [Brachionus plicatilis]|uniref:Microtubule-actin cross-linking factor isoforms 1 2 3 5-like n=1 Tax=Brachionus plicatilis TaxID=10195 RepID=A0A3M7RPN3_BRAPC|nr:microtubule-actin cross-linking factor isoforms 1 2 3 5-like [Brachionus plicatilis]
MSERDHSSRDFLKQDFFRISSKEKMIKLCQKYEIISFLDPTSGIEYSISQIIDLKLFDNIKEEFLCQDKNIRLSIDEAIKLNLVKFKIIEHYFEEISETNTFFQLKSFINENKSKSNIIQKESNDYENKQRADYNEKERTVFNDKERNVSTEKILHSNPRPTEFGEVLWNRILSEIDDLNSNVLNIEKELRLQSHINQNVEELFFRLNETETFKRKLDKIIDGFKRNLNLTQEFYKTNPSNVNFEELRSKHKSIDFNIEKINKEISHRIKNYNDLNETLKKLKSKFSDFMEQIKLPSEQLGEFKKRFNEYPDQLSNLAQNELDLTTIEKKIKSNNLDLQSIANLTQTFNELLKKNDQILIKFKNDIQFTESPNCFKRENLTIIENYATESKVYYESLLRTIDQINMLNHNFSQATSFILSFETWFRSFESKMNEERQMVNFLPDKEISVDNLINNFRNFQNEINEKKLSLKKLENLELNTSIVYEKLTNSPFTQKKSPEHLTRLDSMQNQISNVIQSLLSFNKYQQYLDVMNKKFENVQLNDDVSVQKISKMIENLANLKSDLKLEINNSNNSKIQDNDSINNIIKSISALCNKVDNKCQNLSGLNDLLKLYESKMKQVDIAIDQADKAIDLGNTVKIPQNIDSILNNLMQEKNNLEKNKIECFESIRNLCLYRIEADYVPDLLNTNMLKPLSKSVAEKKQQLKEKIHLIDNNIEYFSRIQDLLIKYYDLVNKIDKWVFCVEQKLAEPIETSFDKLEKQYEINEEILAEYTSRLADIDELNQLSKTNFTIFDKKIEAIQMDNKLRQKFEKKVSLVDLEIKLIKTNQNFDLIGKQLQDRKAILLDSLDKIKTINDEIDFLFNRSQELNLNLCEIKNSIDKNNLNNFELNEKIKLFENDLMKLKSDVDLVMPRIDNHDQDEGIKIKLKKINSNIDSVMSILKELNDFIFDNNFNISNFDHLFKDLCRILEENQSKIDQTICDMRETLINEENAELKLNELKNQIKNINREEKRIKEINEFGEKFFNTLNIMQNLTKLNSNYDIFIDNFESCNSFSKKLIELITVMNNNELNLTKESSLINYQIDNITSSFALDHQNSSTKSYFDQINSIESCNLKTAIDYLENYKNSFINLNENIRDFYLTRSQENFDLHDTPFERKIERMDQQIQNIQNRLKLLNESLSEYSIEQDNFNKTKSILLNFIDTNEKELLNQQTIHDINNVNEKKDFCQRITKQVGEYNLEMQNLININRKIENFNPQKFNQQNRKVIGEIQEKYAQFLEKVNCFAKKIDLCEKCACHILNFENKYQNFENEMALSLNDCTDADLIESYLTRLDEIVDLEFVPTLEMMFKDAQIEMIKTKLEDFKMQKNKLKSKLENKLANVQQQNKQNIKDELDKINSTLELLENSIDYNFDQINAKSEMKRQIEQIFANGSKFEANLKMDDPLQEQINFVKTRQMNLLKKFEDHFSLLNRLQNLQSRLDDIDFKNEQVELAKSIDGNNKEQLNDKMKSVHRAKSELECIKNESVKLLNEIEDWTKKGEMHNNFNDSMMQLKKKMEQLIEKCEMSDKCFAQKEMMFKDKLQNSKRLQDKMENLNAQIKLANSDIESKMELMNSASLVQLDELKNSLDCENKKGEDFKAKIDQISKEIESLDLDINVQCLNYSFSQMENNLKKINQKFEFIISQSCEYEQKVFDLEQSVCLIEDELNQLSKIKYNLCNLESIDTDIDQLDHLTKKLVNVSNDIDDFKELCERLLQNFSTSNSSCYQVEKTMDSLIHKWNQMTRKIDERKNNYIFLNNHLKKLAHDYHMQTCFIDNLDSSWSCNLVLNCVDPIVIKYQFEKMTSIYDNLHQRFLEIGDLKQDAKHLTRLNQDFEAKQTQTLNTQDQVVTESDNKYLEYLSKSASAASLNNLVDLMDSDQILKSIYALENKNVMYKELLNANLNVFHRLYPICDKLSLSLSNLNQSISILECDLDWLDSSSENQICLKDKKDLFEKIHKNIDNNYELFDNDIQNTICSRIIAEINSSSNIECNDLINDINGHIQETRLKLDTLNEKYIRGYEKFQLKQSNSREIYAQMNDILEWLDMIESKYSDLALTISHDVSTIENELNNQIDFNDQVHGQKLKLRKIDVKSQQMMRQNQIEDSIEFKEKLVNIHFQLDNYIEIGASRANRLQEALVICKQLKNTYEPFIKSMCIVQDRLDLLATIDPMTCGPDTKELLSNKLGLLEEIERQLLDKQCDLDMLVKNAKNLIKICDSPKSYMSKVSYLSSDSNLEGHAQILDTNSSFELKKLIDYANETFAELKADIGTKKDELESFVWKSADLTDKIESLNLFLKEKIDLIEANATIAAHPDKIRLQLVENKTLLNDLDKRLLAVEQLTTVAADCESVELKKKMSDVQNMCSELKSAAESREKVLSEALQCSELFWNSLNFMSDLTNDLDDRLQLLESETVAIDPDSVLEQQQYHQQIVKDIDEHEHKFVHIQKYGHELCEFCTLSSDRIEVEKASQECQTDWDRVKKTVKTHEINIQMTFSKACEFQQELIEILEWISLQQEKFVNLDSSLNSDDPKTIRFQINLLKEFKEKVDPKQMKILTLNHKFDQLKLNIRTNQSFEVLESLQEPLNSANKEWKRLQSSIGERKSNLHNILIDMGQLNEALDEIAKSMDTNLNCLQSIDKFVRCSADGPVRTIDLKMARLKMIEKEINSQATLLSRSHHKCNNLFASQSFDNQTMLNELKTKIKSISDSHELMRQTFDQLQLDYATQQTQSSTLVCELIDNFEWLKDVESALDKNFLFAGLPETAREQMHKFNGLFNQIDSNHDAIDALLKRAFECHQKNLIANTLDQVLNESIENLSSKWSTLLRKSSEKKQKLNNALQRACEFNEKYHEFLRWLNQTEKCLNQTKPFSRIQCVLDEQILAHQNLQTSINSQREHLLELDRLATHLKYHSQKQDAILIKNLLISVQNRWQRIVSKSSNRTRDLERGYQQVIAFYDQWNKFNEWLDLKFDLLSKDQLAPVANNSLKIKQQIIKHADFHRMINAQQPTHDNIAKIGRKLCQNCDQDSKDRIFVQEMLVDLKNKWKMLCIESVERQKKLEEALLCSGQFQDALINLTEWLRKVKPTLNRNECLYGDLDNVLALIEDNQQFQKQLQLKAEQVFMINKAASEIMQTSDTENEDANFLNQNLNEMNQLWSDIDELSQHRTQRLQDSLKLASQFNDSAKLCMDWLKHNELCVKQDWKKIDDNQISALIRQHQDFVAALDQKRQIIDQCLDLGNGLLQNCIPEAVASLNHLITLIQTKWNEIQRLSNEKSLFLSETLENVKKNDNLLNEILVWLQGAEATLTALDQKPLSNNLELVDQLLKDHVDFQNELQQRQVKIDAILKNTSKDFDSYLLNTMVESKKRQSYAGKSRTLEWKITEPKIKNARIKSMFDSWRKVWLMTLERHKKLKELADRLKEIEKLKQFNFNEWRQRFMNWHKDNRARITDFFRRQDKDHDGKISRDEFVKGILNTNFPSSRLELECVADIFDHDKDGYIDYKEFLATLKPSASNQPNFERIRDEVHKQVSLCKCSKQYHVLQVSERHFRFGDSQKLRLVRILQSTVMVRVGGGWMALDEFLVKNDPCRAKGRLNFDLRDQFLNRESNINNDRPKSPFKLKSRNLMNSNGKKNNSQAISDQSELLSNTPIFSGKNSKSGSLGASISDLSLEAVSDYAENLEKSSKISFGNVSSPKQSKVPILKKNC